MIRQTEPATSKCRPLVDEVIWSHPLFSHSRTSESRPLPLRDLSLGGDKLFASIGVLGHPLHCVPKYLGSHLGVDPTLLSPGAICLNLLDSTECCNLGPFQYPC